MECVPRARLLVENVAMLFELFVSVNVPIVVAPSLNVTVPVAVPEGCVLIVAVKVTDWPNAEGFALEARAVDVPLEVTLQLVVVELARKMSSPL
jgi:hypothetical protein